MNGKSKSRPTRAGCHSSWRAPCGKYTNARRELGFAALCASTVPAGIIASSSGRAIVAPAPLRTVRRDSFFLKTNIYSPPKLLVGCSLRRRCAGRIGAAFAERIAGDDAKDERLEPVVVRARLADDATDGRHVAVIEGAAQGVGQEILRQRLHELVIGPVGKRPA